MELLSRTLAYITGGLFTLDERQENIADLLQLKPTNLHKRHKGFEHGMDCLCPRKLIPTLLRSRQHQIHVSILQKPKQHALNVRHFDRRHLLRRWRVALDLHLPEVPKAEDVQRGHVLFPQIPEVVAESDTRQGFIGCFLG